MRYAEIRERMAHKLRQRADARKLPDFHFPAVPAPAPNTWPQIPDPTSVPYGLRTAMEQELGELFAGRARFFGHLEVVLEDPPLWFKDYAARRVVLTGRSGFHLNHRELPRGTDIKSIWELSRWGTLVRWAQGAAVLKDAAAQRKAMDWMRDWCRQNPPYMGWNWTSALEAGMRLLNFAWIDALLMTSGAEDKELQDLRQRVLPAHVWYTWRHRSFGTSANNHLLGELAGLITVIARWPVLADRAVSLEELQVLWESEVLAQFAADGGNREQALHYQLYAWELCWHTVLALRQAERPVSAEVEERLRRAADFYVAMQVPSDPWDYGDDDSASAVPLVADDARGSLEWLEWLCGDPHSRSLSWWLGEPPAPFDPPACQRPVGEWLVFPESGQAACWTGDWHVRWDLSPLGYQSMAAHGHLDALHVSLWRKGVALVIDPGTGAYYGDTRLRGWLASAEAHNGPHLPRHPYPRRLGPFLWSEHHAPPAWQPEGSDALDAQRILPAGVLRRRVRRVFDGERDGWQIDDVYEPSAAGEDPEFAVTWQFAPGTRIEVVTERSRVFRGERRGVRFTVGFDAAWERVELIPETSGSLGFPVEGDLVGLCSPAFRRVLSGPVIRLKARRLNPNRFRTTFLADDPTVDS